jgi:hypothetical protein
MKNYITYSVFKGNELIDAYFILRKSKSKHLKLKSCANGKDYWFEGLTGRGWFRGGFYNGGFINASLDRVDNVQGVVLNNEVYILLDVVTIKPKFIKEL